MEPTPILSLAGRRAVRVGILASAVTLLLTIASPAGGPMPPPAKEPAVQPVPREALPDPAVQPSDRAHAAGTLSANPPESAPRTGQRQFRGQLRPSGRWLVYPDGSRFRWRGVTGFMLNERVSSGHDDDAAAFLTWARETGFNVVRTLVMLPKGWFTDSDFTPEEGLAALPRTLALARDADIYVEVTVLANTASLPSKADLGSYVERAGRICAAAANCALVEVANEFWHPTQRAEVHDPTALARWAARVPAGIPTALGAPPGGSAALVDRAPVITVHIDRGGDRWERARRVRALGEESVRTNRFVVDNEPVGADEREQPGRRDSLPDVFFAQGALSRVFEVGSNFHFESGLRARVPGPIQQECAEAFVAGTRIVDDSYMLTFQDAGWPYSPVRKARVAAAYAGLTQVFPPPTGPSSVLVLLGTEGDPGVEWRLPWQRTGAIAVLTQVQVWSIARVPQGP